MAKFFKFLEEKYVDSFLSGTLKISSLSYYREIYEDTKDSHIGDEFEGSSKATVEMMNIHGSDSEGIQGENFRKMFPGLDVDGPVTIKDCAFVRRYRDLFIFCFSSGFIGDFRGVMYENESSLFNYNAAIEIESPKTLAKCIFETGVIPELGGAKFSDLFKKGRIRKVKYENIIFDATQQSWVDASPVKKSMIYKKQREERILFDLIEPLSSNKFLVEYEVPPNLFRIVKF